MDNKKGLREIKLNNKKEVNPLKNDPEFGAKYSLKRYFHSNQFCKI